MSSGAPGREQAPGRAQAPGRMLASSRAPARVGVSCDIGTTTIVLELIDLDTGEILATHAALNSQKRFGADVLSRVNRSLLGSGPALRAAILGDLSAGIASLLSSVGSGLPRLESVRVAANTVMYHLLFGLSCEGLSRAPFTPERLDFPPVSLAELFAGHDPPRVPLDAEVRFVPSFSAFIGGDVVAGLVVLGLDGSGDSAGAGEGPGASDSSRLGDGAGKADGPRASAGPRVLIDLGTNAEMAVSAHGVIYCASASAGPAFEGGKISCGMGGVAGAVNGVWIEGSKFGFSVIGGAVEPAGLCGSGLLDLAARSLELGLIARDGSLSAACARGGIRLGSGTDVALREADVRELQLAKAAIRAGLETLLGAAGVAARDVERCYLAGGFGLYLKEESALEVGLIPASFASRVSAPGNTSLMGARAFLLDPTFEERARRVISRMSLVQLAESGEFARLFIDSMSF